MIKSVTKNFVQLYKTIILGIIVMYVYAFIAFVWFPSHFNQEGDFKNYCTTLFNCFFTVINNGLRAGGGIGEAIGQVGRQDPYFWY